ncbi:MAG TPA: type IV secretory system conjugative DNA transfer family protein [Acidimicrobiales bacterium]|nr:type IV secretory system conjugative DNA transfer family protein [Acidimicrobiales bacterium]
MTQNSNPQKIGFDQQFSSIFLGLGEHGPLWCAPEICALVLGPPRAGKTTTIIIPNIILAKNSVISVSTKSDVIDATNRIRADIGPCFLFDPTNALVSARDVQRVGWSPLHSASNWERAVLTADAMVGATGNRSDRDGSHWRERASALLATLFHAAALDESPMARVVQAVNRRDAEHFVEVLARRDANLALDLLAGIRETDSREQSGIWSTASGVLSAFRMGATLASTLLPGIDWKNFVERPSTLYVASPSDHQTHIAPLIAGLIRDLRSYSAERFSSLDPSKAFRVLLILDELANIAPLHDLPVLIAEGASQGIVTLASLQDLSQARSRWGIAGEGFLSLFGAKVIFGGIGDRATLSNISALAGEHYVRSISVTKRRHLGSWVGTGTQIGMTREPRLSLDAIAVPPPGEATVIIGAEPHHCRLVPYFAHS